MNRDKHLGWKQSDVDAYLVERTASFAAIRTLVERHPKLLVWFDDLVGAMKREAELEKLLEASVTQMKGVLSEVRQMKVEIATLERLAAERGPLIEELRAMRAEHDPTRLANLLHAAREEATIAASKVIKNLTSEVVDLRRERDDLAASKKKLREALDRAKEKR